ncbi:MAG: hypothetical protein OEZ14_01255 [Acidimicrobiia bacterium]|nr:hypothetical protein [Acidimicrobiia bacterium]MDH5519135.1 hypothetical protein [Acidimicrobiia bacterium]
MKWFDGLDAPWSTTTSRAAQPGWSVNLEDVKLDSRWHAVESATSTRSGPAQPSDVGRVN